MKKIKRVIIFGSGRLVKKYLAVIKPSDFIIGADRGAYWLIENYIAPGLAIGDFDSVKSGEFKIIKDKSLKVAKFSEDKDFTDMDLALKAAVKLGPEEIIIYGAIGTRLDQTISSVHLLESISSYNIKITILDDKNKIQLIKSEIFIKKDNSLPYLSILPITDEITVTLKGFKFDISKKVIKRGQTIGISNQINGINGVITIHKGKALVIQSRD